MAEQLRKITELRRVEISIDGMDEMKMTLETPAVFVIYGSASAETASGLKSIVTVSISVYLVMKFLKSDNGKIAELLNEIRKILHGFRFGKNDELVLLWKRENLVDVENKTYIYEQSYDYKDYLVR